MVLFLERNCAHKFSSQTETNARSICVRGLGHNEPVAGWGGFTTPCHWILRPKFLGVNCRKNFGMLLKISLELGRGPNVVQERVTEIEEGESEDGRISQENQRNC